jgi:hypothetical protein
VLNWLRTTPWRCLGECGCIDLRILDLGTSWREVDSFTPWRFTPCTHWIGGWVGIRTDLDDVERRKILPLPEIELPPLCRPARSQSLYWVRYLGSMLELQETVGAEFSQICATNFDLDSQMSNIIENLWIVLEKQHADGPKGTTSKAYVISFCTKDP